MLKNSRVLFVMILLFVTGVCFLSTIKAQVKEEVAQDKPLLEINFNVDVGEQELVLKQYDPKKYYLKNFPDGKMAIFKKDGLYYWLGTGMFADEDEAGIYISRTLRFVGKDFNSMNPDPVDKKGRPISVLDSDGNSKIDPSNAIVGSVYFDEKRNLLHTWYQACDYENFPEYVLERQKEFPTGEVEQPYYCSIAAAVSKNLGKSFTKLGEVLTQQFTRDDIIKGKTFSVDTTVPAVVKMGEYLYMYYSDQNQEEAGISVARLKIMDSDKKPQPWEKYFNKKFTEPGIGGKFDVVAGGSFPDVSSNSYLKKWIMFHHGTENDAEIYMRVSDDGLKWSETVQIIKDKPENMNVTPTIMDENDDPTITDDEFYLYYLHSTDGRGQNTWMARRKIILKEK